MSRQANIEQAAADWLTRREGEGFTPADQAALDAWLEEAHAHKLAFWRLEEGWRQADRLAALREPSVHGRSRPRRWAPWAVAAGLALVAVGGAAVTWRAWPGLGAQSYQTVVGGHQTVPLADGSKVELNTDTRLRTAVGRQSREVWLDQGEAYFDVAHDPSRPFVVWAGDRRVTVLGTKFSVRRDGDQVHVAGGQGKVRIDPVKPSVQAKPKLALPGDVVVAQGPSTVVAPRSVENVEGELSWRQGMLTFDQVSLADAAEEFNRYNRTKIVVADAATAQTLIGGTFEAENIEAFGRLLKGAYGLQVTRRDGEIEISGGAR